MSKKILLAAMLAAALPLAANAGTDSDSFTVQLEVLNSCTLTAGGVMDFGTVTGNIAADRDATTDLTVNCNSGALYTIGLDDGLNHDGTSRVMASGSDEVSYELYTTTTRDLVWEDLGETNVVGGTGSNADQTVTVFGRVPAMQSVAAGNYADTVTATISF